MKKRTATILLTVFTLFAFANIANASVVKGTVQTVTLNTLEKSDKIIIHTNHPDKLPRYKYADLKKMIYVDIFDTDGPTINKTYNATIVSRIRTASHKKEGYFRVSIDLNKKTPFIVKAEKNILSIEFIYNSSKPLSKAQAQSTLQKEKKLLPQKKRVEPSKKIIKDPIPSPLPIARPKKILQKKTPPTQQKKRMPVPPVKHPENKEPPKPEPLISLELKDINIATVLKALAKKAGLNIIVSEKIDKKITVSFKDVPAGTAFYSVINSGGYITRNQGGVIIIQSEDEGDQGFQTKVFTIAHANLNEIGGMLKGLLSKEGSLFTDRASKTIFVRDNRSKILELERWLELIDTPERDFSTEQTEVRVFKIQNTDVKKIEDMVKTFLSREGKLSIDSDTNRIIVKESYKNMETVAKAIKNLDFAPKQVMVEAAIIEVRLEDESQLGVNWEYISENADSSFKGNILGFAQEANPAGSGLFISAAHKKITGLLDALATNTDFNLLAHPKIMALNDQEAEIVVGSRLGFKVVSTSPSGVTSESIKFLEVGTKLVFTPHITENNRIILDLHPEVSEGSISQAGLPIETTSEANTKVSIADGETIIIGGLMKKKIVEVDTQIPVLGSIPLIGYFFKKKEKAVFNNEILVFITPTIVKNTPLQDDLLQKKALEKQFETK